MEAKSHRKENPLNEYIHLVICQALGQQRQSRIYLARLSSSPSPSIFFSEISWKMEFKLLIPIFFQVKSLITDDKTQPKDKALQGMGL